MYSLWQVCQAWILFSCQHKSLFSLSLSLPVKWLLSLLTRVRISFKQEKEGKSFPNNMKKIQSYLLPVNVSWFLEDLELDNQYGFHESFGFTVARLITLIMAIIVHRGFYNLMKRLPGRPVNQMIYPYMVRCLCKSQFLFCLCPTKLWSRYDSSPE